MTIGDKIKTHRKHKGLTQTELGNICGASKQTIFKYENGIITNIPLDKLEAIADALGVTTSYLIGWEQTEKPTVGEDDGLSERERQLIQLVRRLSDKQVDGLLDLLRSQQPQEK